MLEKCIGGRTESDHNIFKINSLRFEGLLLLVKSRDFVGRVVDDFLRPLVIGPVRIPLLMLNLNLDLGYSVKVCANAIADAPQFFEDLVLVCDQVAQARPRTVRRVDACTWDVEVSHHGHSRISFMPCIFDLPNSVVMPQNRELP